MYLTNFHFYPYKNYHYSKSVKGLCGCEVSYGFGFNGKERDNETYGEGNTYDFGARIYDPRLGRWMRVDPLQINYSSWSPYNYVRGNPILKVDVGGEWDVEIHAYNDRAKFGYAIVIVKDRCGNEIARYTCRVIGKNRDRTKSNNDSPTGTYKIGDWRGIWVKMDDKCAFGYNAGLRLTYQGGEAPLTRQGIMFHGGRQTDECDNASWIDKNEPLQETHGCFRFFDEDLKKFKEITDNLTANDPLDIPNQVTLSNDLIKNPEGNYNVPSDINNANSCYTSTGSLTNSLLNPTSKESMMESLNTFKESTVQDAKNATQKREDTEIKCDKSNIEPQCN